MLPVLDLNSSASNKWDSEGIWVYAESPDLSPDFFISCGILLFTFFVFGSTSNGAVLIAFFRHPEIITPFQYFLVNLVASDFVMIALGAPWDLLAIWQNGWKLGKTPCLIVGFIKMFCGCTSLLTLTVLSVQRCLYVWSPAFFSIRGYRLPKYLIVFIWSLSASFSVPPFFGWSEYVPEQCGLSCAPCFQDPRYKDYSIYILVAGFIIPLIVIITSSALTILRLRFYAQLKAKANLKSDLISRREWKATLMVLVMVLVFFLSWSGYSTICLLRIFGVDYPDISVAISMMTAKSSAWTNCLIYIGMNSRIRRYVLPDWCLIFSDPDDDSSMEEKAVTHQREEDDGEAEDDNEDGKIPKFNQIAPDNIDFEIDGGIYTGPTQDDEVGAAANVIEIDVEPVPTSSANDEENENK